MQSGFGLGTAEHWTLPGIARIVGKLRDQLGIADRNIVFIGFAGGGFASLVLASWLPGASCLLNNPNTGLLKERRSALSKVLKFGYPELLLPELARQFPERFIALEALKACPVPLHLYCLQNARQDVRQVRVFMTGMIGSRAQLPEPVADHDDSLIVNYHVDDQIGNKAVKPEQWTRHLERITEWSPPRWSRTPERPDRAEGIVR
ncbi:hypothetical protein KHC28_12250 [Ancylobacter sonchi]|uniref:hypothetical protein n=1 Tax=Ancylobacter sonchi TaxID=1937790 RepID=UPI001BD49DD8|nr:hypothetical protein [Ancylobacter sonchi]MBS7534429.1 hypothetical protein [Ancylobacter sonchi]